MIVGERVSRQGTLSVATSAVIVDGQSNVLLTRRRDTGLWCLPGGIMESGESVAEAVVREVREETGLDVVPGQLVGVYSSPDLLVSYADGTRHHPVVLCFRCDVVGGALRLSDETTDVGFFRTDELPDVVEPHRQRVSDALAGSVAAFIR